MENAHTKSYQAALKVEGEDIIVGPHYGTYEDAMISRDALIHKMRQKGKQPQVAWVSIIKTEQKLELCSSSVLELYKV